MDARLYLESLFAEVLGGLPEGFDRGGNFDELALTSVANLSIVARMEADLGALPATLLFEYPTLPGLTGYLVEHFPERFAPPAAPAVDPAVPAAVPGYHELDVAVIGVSGRYPGAPDVRALWRRLSAADVCIEEIPAQRWDWRQYFDERGGVAGRTYSRWGGFLPDVDCFDAAFFRILPREAGRMDPQQRLFLETAWNLLDGAGYLAESTRQPETGVFVGTMYGTYGRIGASEGERGTLTGPDAPVWSIANRVSYFFDLHGPSYAIDSACSASLSAVHLAVQSLRAGECRMAIAGGVNLILHPSHYVSLSAMNMLSHSDRCRVFDERADGFVPGEGVGAVLLKPLAAALADGDDVWGVIRASHVNNDGRTTGYTVPNPAAQGALIAETYRRAGIDPRTVTYVEAHGTGTALGDPIEVAGLRRGFGTDDKDFCALGSVKANIGHLEGAAGIAGLTKVLLQLRYGQIAPCATLDTVNPKIDFEGSPFYLPRELADWSRATVDGVEYPRRGAVSSFGAGGTNVHVLVEEYAGAERPATSAPRWASAGQHVVLLSGRTRAQLGQQVDALADMLAGLLEGPPGARPTLAAIAYTSQVGRAEMAYRCAVLAAELPALVDALRSGLDGLITGVAGSGETAGTLFTGPEGAAMLRSLLDRGELAWAAKLWTQGAPVDWRTWWGPQHPTRVAFPDYPFERRRYWYEPSAGR